jgi:hypothetical protein
MSHSANARRHSEKPNCQNYCEHNNTQMQKSLQESANFYRSLAMVVGRRESISRADHKTNPFHWVSVVAIPLSALHCCGHTQRAFVKTFSSGRDRR